MEDTKNETYGAWVDWRYFKGTLFLSVYSAVCNGKITNIDITDVDDLGNIYSVYD